MTAYYIQRSRHGATCSLFALINACRFFGLRAPRPGGKEFERLRILGACVAGSCIHVTKMAHELGLSIKLVDYRQVVRYVPAMYDLWHPQHGFHAVLVIDGSPKHLTMVNYHIGNAVRRSTVTVPRSQIELLPRHLRRARALRPQNE